MTDEYDLLQQQQQPLEQLPMGLVEQPQEIFKVYVRGPMIGEGVSQADLRATFEKCGEVLDVYAHQGRNFAFVQFARKEEAEQAVLMINDTEVNGCRLTVELAKHTGQQQSGDRRDRRDRDTKPGDWSCPGCHVNNFARRDRCFRCQVDKPRGGGYDDRRGGFGGYGQRRGRSRDRDDRRGGGGNGGYGGGYGGYDRRNDYDRRDHIPMPGAGGMYDRMPGGYDDRAPRRRSKSRN
ncbi:hypothetical protein BASA81_014012 [Batrachochytrium salamandrivorans]|nr:hypothetical protein BASA81_014012 [Batrachochytrium salamandrivorans]